MPSNHLALCHLLLFLLWFFSNESALRIRWPKYWNFNFSISPSSEHPGLISFRMDWLDLLAVQGTLKSLLQHHSWKASVLWRSAFFVSPWTPCYFICRLIVVSLSPASSTWEQGCCITHSCTWPGTASAGSKSSVNISCSDKWKYIIFTRDMTKSYRFFFFFLASSHWKEMS